MPTDTKCTFVILVRWATILIYTIKQMLNDYANNNINIGFIYQV